VTQESATDNKLEQSGDRVQPVEKVVISSVVTHASLLDAIKKRNPIIAGRAEPKR
jgi:hypothetical protein